MRETAGNGFPIVTWGTFTAGSALQLFQKPGKEVDVRLLRYGTEEEVMPTMSQVCLFRLRRLIEVCINFNPQYIEEVTGQVVTIPGVPPMYEYEYYPQEVRPICFIPFDKRVFYTVLQIPLVGNIFVEIARKYIPTTDGIFVASSSAYDGKCVEALKEWFGTRGKDVYPVGPLALPEPPSSQEKSKEVVEFLNKMQAKHGEKSVIYASLCSISNPCLIAEPFLYRCHSEHFSGPKIPKKSGLPLRRYSLVELL